MDTIYSCQAGLKILSILSVKGINIYHTPVIAVIMKYAKDYAHVENETVFSLRTALKIEPCLEHWKLADNHYLQHGTVTSAANHTKGSACPIKSTSLQTSRNQQKI